MMSIAVKYGIDDLRYWTETVKNAVRFSFVYNLRRKDSMESRNHE